MNGIGGVIAPEIHNLISSKILGESSPSASGSFAAEYSGINPGILQLKPIRLILNFRKRTPFIPALFTVPREHGKSRWENFRSVYLFCNGEHSRRGHLSSPAGSLSSGSSC